MSLHEHALYQVATKALIYKEDKVLVLHTPDGYLDFPGGRVDESERNIPWTDALKREVSEEVGDSMQISIGQTLFVSKRQYTKNGTSNHIAAIFYKCQHESGEVKLSDEHGYHEWLTIEELIGRKGKFISEDERAHLKNLPKK
jgi:8-oxo-dGTP pyrophosphatase MutT (NUDIX family)